MRNLKNGKAADENEVMGEILNGGDDMVVDWIWRMCSMVVESGVVPEDWRSFESGVIPEDWRSVLIVTLYKGKGDMIKCKNYRRISLLIILFQFYFLSNYFPVFQSYNFFCYRFYSTTYYFLTSAMSHK